MPIREQDVHLPQSSVVPTLDEIANDCTLASGLSVAKLAALTVKCAAVQSILAAQQLRLASEPAIPKPYGLTDQNDNDQTVDADEIAKMLGQTRRWVFRNWKRLPFVRRVSRKCLVARESEVRRWLDMQRL
jgi:hypothetical protein